MHGAESLTTSSRMGQRTLSCIYAPVGPIKKKSMHFLESRLGTSPMSRTIYSNRSMLPQHVVSRPVAGQVPPLKFNALNKLHDYPLDPMSTQVSVKKNLKYFQMAAHQKTSSDYVSFQNQSIQK